MNVESVPRILDTSVLSSVIQNERRNGKATLAAACWSEPQVLGVREALIAGDWIVSHVGFKSPQSWVRLPEGIARLHLKNCLQFDLAYGGECMQVQRAEELAGMFVSLIYDMGGSYFTNVHPAESQFWNRVDKNLIVNVYENEIDKFDHGFLRRASSGTNLTNSTFDSGIVTISRIGAAILWFEDED